MAFTGNAFLGLQYNTNLFYRNIFAARPFTAAILVTILLQVPMLDPALVITAIGGLFGTSGSALPVHLIIQPKPLNLINLEQKLNHTINAVVTPGSKMCMAKVFKLQTSFQLII